jgi:hypothetical protein
MATRTYESDREDVRAAQRAAFQTEHWVAWLLAIVAIVMGVIGLLAGFGILGEDDAGEGVAQAIAAELTNWQEGMIWLLAAVPVGLVALALHNTEHHTGVETHLTSATENRGLFNTEHWLAYLMGLATLVCAALAVLVGFDVFENDNTFADGMLWGLAGLVTGVLTVTLHAVRHHQHVADESVIVRIIEERGVGTQVRPTGERVTGTDVPPR